jgi:hypothetical protein
MIDGYTPGDLIILLLPRFTESWLVMKMFILFTNGSGKASVNPSTRSSFGF